MNDRAVELLEQYEIEVFRTRKGRGAFLCDTDRGCLIFKEYTGNAERLKLQNTLLNHIEKDGRVQTEQLLADKEGNLFVKDVDGIKYILKTWREGRECNSSDRKECAEAVRLLAGLHKRMLLPAKSVDIPVAFSPEKEYDKHNKELKKVRKFLSQKGQKTWFEISLAKHFDFFLEQALSITDEWKQYRASMNISAAQAQGEGFVAFCHGDYQYHNIIKTDEGWFLANFEKCMADHPIRDLYLLMRKLLEKSEWSVELGRELLEAYEQESPLSALSRIDLYYRLAYPEKFWKIANFYYNSGKAWIPGRNQEKLDKLVSQESVKQQFLDEVFRDVSKQR